MTDKQKITLQVTSDEKESFRGLAKSLGYIVPYGTEKGEGNMSAFVRAIAAGEVVCARREIAEAVAKRVKND